MWIVLRVINIFGGVIHMISTILNLQLGIGTCYAMITSKSKTPFIRTIPVSEYNI